MRQGIIILIVAGLLLSCGEEAVQDRSTIPVETNDLTYVSPEYELTGKAAKITSQWDDYQRFITELRNLGPTTQKIGDVAELVQELGKSLPDSLRSTPVRVRLKVLETRVRSYASYLSYNTTSTAERADRYNKMITALDNFHLQLMDEFEYGRFQQEIEDRVQEMMERDSINRAQRRGDTLDIRQLKSRSKPRFQLQRPERDKD